MEQIIDISAIEAILRYFILLYLDAYYYKERVFSTDITEFTRKTPAALKSCICIYIHILVTYIATTLVIHDFYYF